MAHDKSATAWIAAVKTSIKEAKTLDHQYYDKFITRKQKATDADVKSYTALMTKIQALQKLMHEDLHEAQQAMAGFGGPGDTMNLSMKNMLSTLKKQAAAE